MSTEIKVETDVLSRNQKDANEVRRSFAEQGIYVLNLMSGPGAGKTTLLERTAEVMGKRLRMAVIAGDLETNRDAERLGKYGVPVVQVNTSGACHMEAHQIARVVEGFDLANLDLIIVENVGNMVCPAEFDLGETDRVMVLSCTEGHDKPGKYPLMFRESRLLLLNKTDLLPYVYFDVDAAIADARAVNPTMEVIPVSATKGEGMSTWFDWLVERVKQVKQARGR
jgi:hydrogenase nickel incorporation protein HypB